MKMATNASVAKQTGIRFFISLAMTVLLYGGAAWWVFQNSEKVDSFSRLSFYSLILLLGGMLVIHLLFRPLRYSVLLSRFGIKIKFGQAFRQRLFIMSSKVFVPLSIGDPLGAAAVLRNWRLSPSQIAIFWITDKMMLVLMLPILVAMAMITDAGFAGLGIALGIAMVLVFASVPLFFSNYRWQRLDDFVSTFSFGARLKLLSLTFVQELIEVAVFGLLLLQILDLNSEAIRYIDLVWVSLAASLPLAVGGAGTREAAALLLFNGKGDAADIFLVAFSVTMFLKIIPASLGLLFFRSSIGKGGAVA